MKPLEAFTIDAIIQLTRQRVVFFLAVTTRQLFVGRGRLRYSWFQKYLSDPVGSSDKGGN